MSALFRLYVSHFGNYNKVYGTVGAFIVLLLWLFLTALVMLIGGQLNVAVGRAMQKPADQVRRNRLPSLAKSTLQPPLRR
jgi:membrane protein